MGAVLFACAVIWVWWGVTCKVVESVLALDSRRCVRVVLIYWWGAERMVDRGSVFLFRCSAVHYLRFLCVRAWIVICGGVVINCLSLS